MANVFLLIGNESFLIRQGTEGKIIIGDDNTEGASGGLVTKTVGRSLVTQQVGERPTITAKATSLGTLLLQNLFNVTKSKLVIPIFLKSKSRIVAPKAESISYSKLLISKQNRSKASIIKIEKHLKIDKFKLESFIKYDSVLKKNNPLQDKIYNIEKNLLRTKLLRMKVLLEELRQTPSIQVGVNSDITQRGNLLRITSTMNTQTPQIWMRIIDTNGMIVQKAGLVKKDSTGFQILIGTKDLETGKYIIQVSNHRSFSPLGVSEFEIKGISPLVGIISLVPLIPSLIKFPDSPETFKKVIFRTMIDSRVDAQCKEFENKVFDINNPDLPVPPIHFNCRCHLEGIDD